jgi:hypothetical protein
MGHIPPHKTWEIHDASKLQTFMGCPREYFYRYVLGWEPEGSNVHLVFGSAWHLAMETLLLEGYTAEAVAHGYDQFMEEYRKTFTEGDDMTNGVKTPANALRGLTNYVKHWRGLDKFEVLETEVAGIVPVRSDANLHFRIDAIVRDIGPGPRGGKVFILEHKTGSQDSRQWRDQWSLSMQVGLYTHVLYSSGLVDPKEIFGAVVNGAIIRKNDEAFVRVPVRKTADHMRTWLWNVKHWYDMIQWNFAELEQCTPDEPVMMAFPMNTGNCTKYFGCAYHDFCTAWANPLKRCEATPMGYQTRWWNPADNDSTAKKVLELEAPKDE